MNISKELIEKAKTGNSPFGESRHFCSGGSFFDKRGRG